MISQSPPSVGPRGNAMGRQARNAMALPATTAVAAVAPAESLRLPRPRRPTMVRAQKTAVAAPSRLPAMGSGAVALG